MREQLVLLPGMNCSPRLWGKVIEQLPTAVPGARPTPDVIVEPLDQPRLDRQVDALLDRLPPRFALGGLSLGAIVAMALHRRAPDRVTGLFLVATNPRPPTDAQRSSWHTQLARLAAGDTPRDLQADLLPLLVGAGAAAFLAHDALEMAQEVGSAHLAAQLQLQLSRVDERPALRGVAVPCAVVAGGDDQICPLERNAEIRDLVPGSELTVIPEAPHLVTLSHPRHVAAAITIWLRRLNS